MRPRFTQTSAGRPQARPAIDCLPNLSDLALHKAKVDQILAALDGQRPLIVISGPAGSAKSTAVRVASRSLVKRIVEWSDQTYAVGETSVMQSFRDFLSGAVLQPSDTVILIDELPNIFHDETHNQFKEALWQWIQCSTENSPHLVVVFSELGQTTSYADSMVAQRIFGEILEDERCCWIKINPVNSTLLTKTLSRYTDTPKDPAVAKSIRILSQSGDVRQALVAFSNWLDSPRSSVPSVRTTQVGLFHLIGKLVFGTETSIQELENMILEYVDIKETVLLTLLENYTSAKYQQLDIPTVSTAAEWMSLGDLGLPLAATSLGVHDTINAANPDPLQPRKFKPLTFTQATKWRGERAVWTTRVRNDYAEQREVGPVSILASMDIRAFNLMSTMDFLDIDSESDSNDSVF